MENMGEEHLKKRVWKAEVSGVRLREGQEWVREGVESARRRPARSVSRARK